MKQPMENHYTSIKRIFYTDRSVGNLALAMSIVSLIMTWISNSLFVGLSFSVPVLLLVFCMAYAKSRGSIRDPVLIAGLVIIMYTLTPYLGDPMSSNLLTHYGVEGGFYINNFAISGYFIGVCLSNYAMPMNNFIDKVSSTKMDINSTRIASLTSSVLSIVLILIYISKFGIISGSDDYAAGFEDRLTSGVGFLLISIPLALSALAFSIMSERHLLSSRHILPIICFALLLLGLGQRKYIIIPVLFIAFFFVKVKNTRNIIFAVTMVIIFWLVFCYIGYIRINNIDLIGIFSSDNLFDFYRHSDEYIAGETLAIHATASAAYLKIVDPLPFLGDYLLSWKMSVPQVFFGSSFEPVNVRFSYIFSPIQASKGQGWGFSFWGEAYMVGGPLMTVISSVVMVFIFRFLFVKSEQEKWLGIFSVIAICSSYYALWFQRNGFAYFFREFIVYQCIPIFSIALFSSFLAKYINQKPIRRFL